MVKMVPIVMHCAACAADVELDGVQGFRYRGAMDHPLRCRQGRELEIEAIEIEEGAVTETAASPSGMTR